LKPRLQLSREAEILELSEDIANEDSESGRVCPTRICGRKEIKLIHDSYGKGKFDGMLVYRNGAWVILCNCDNGNVPGCARERFTISHELGHYHIPEHRRQLMAGCGPHGSYAGAFDGAESIEELEADTFAANFLMPPGRFLPRLQSMKLPPLAAVVVLRKEFDASLESASIQAMRHDSRVVAIAKWDADSLAWHRISEPFFRATGYRQFRLREKHTLPPDCATVASFNDYETHFDSTIHEAVVTAAFCFGHVAAGGKRDILLREEAVRNGRFGVVSIFSLLNEAQRKQFQ
jgi:Zn-dependent peptidase ImmA (M78 family)